MWKNININKNQIKVNTGKSALINCPHNSKYDGFSFWHPAKLIRDGKHSASISLGYTEEFKFNLIKYGKGKYNGNDIIDTREIDYKEFENMFNIEDSNIITQKVKNNDETYKPQTIEPILNNLNKELLDE